MASILAVLPLGYLLYTAGSGDKVPELLKETYKPDKYAKASPVLSEAFQIAEDKDVSNGLRTGDNRSAMNVYANENLRIVRSRDSGDIHDVFGNALRFQNDVRKRNLELGLMNSDIRNRQTLLIPSYDSKFMPISDPNGQLFGGKLVGQVQIDRTSTAPYGDTVAETYRQPYGDYVEPVGGPKNAITPVEKFGNPWGPGGIYNSAIIEGARRGLHVGMYKDGDPAFEDYPKRRTNRRVTFDFTNK